MPNDKTLWDRLQAFEPDQADAAFRFSDRLARENGWSRDFARGAISEYKRFVYLAATSPTQVTPSDIVDQVWHLHLTFTRSYWDEMCTKVVGRPLHHGPTKGGRAEDRRYRNQYAETLAFYRQTFGEEPPAAYWPAEQERFSSGLHQQWVDRRTHFVVPRASVLRGALAGLATVGLAAVASTAAAEPAVDADLEAYLVPGGIALAVLVIAFAAMGSRGGRRRQAGKAGASSSSSSGYVFGCTATSSGSKGGKDGNGGEGGETGGESGGESGGDGGGGDGGGGCGGGGCGGGG